MPEFQETNRIKPMTPLSAKRIEFNHALQRTRRERRGCNRGVPCAGSLSLGRYCDMKSRLSLLGVAQLGLTKSCFSQQVFHGSRRLVGGASYCQGSGASPVM